MATEPDYVTNFVTNYGPAANIAASQLGLTQADVLGQWGEETAWGQHMAGTNNPGNVEANGVVANYSTLQEGISAYASAVAHEGANNQDSATSFATALQNGGYAGSDKNYATEITGAIQTAVNAGASTTPLSGSFANGTFTSGQYATPPNGTQVGSGSAVTSWLTGHAGNWALIGVGVVLAIGALLISQKETIVNVAGSAAKVAAIA